MLKDTSSSSINDESMLPCQGGQRARAIHPKHTTRDQCALEARDPSKRARGLRRVSSLLLVTFTPRFPIGILPRIKSRRHHFSTCLVKCLVPPYSRMKGYTPLLVSLVIHVGLIGYAHHVDTHPYRFGGLKYTDVDWRVVTDGAGYIFGTIPGRTASGWLTRLLRLPIGE